jgi:hypothetical protein
METRLVEFARQYIWKLGHIIWNIYCSDKHRLSKIALMRSYDKITSKIELLSSISTT